MRDGIDEGDQPASQADWRAKYITFAEMLS